MDKKELLSFSEFPSNSHCAICAYMDVYINDNGDVFDRHTNGRCQKYPQGIGKPRKVIYDGAKCPHYREWKPTTKRPAL